MTNLSALHYYPIKACRGQAVDAAFVERRGLQNDRRFMIVDLQGRFMTQRDEPALALVVPQLTDTSLSLSAPNMPGLNLPVAASGPMKLVSVWSSDAVKAIDQGDEAAEWFSFYLEVAARLPRQLRADGMAHGRREAVRLVYMPEESIRPVNRQYAVRPDDHVSFADGYPILIASQESLDDLNARLETPLPMDRFRPNLVVAGCPPFEEDGWKRIRIGEVELAIVKPCARCEVTTIDQASAVRSKEPLETLATFRRADGNKVMFGMNVIPLNEGRLRVGDPVEILVE
jgi:hypothetical protein